MLQHVIDNVNQAKLVNKVVVAQPYEQKIPFRDAEKYEYTGDENDVLNRYMLCAEKYEADTIVRVTSDCPIINGELIDFAIRSYFYSALPYINIAPHDGKNVEVFSYRILQKAFINPKDDYDREHVTPYMQRATKLSVDTPSDLKKVRKWIDGRKPNA